MSASHLAAQSRSSPPPSPKPGLFTVCEFHITSFTPDPGTQALTSLHLTLYRGAMAGYCCGCPIACSTSRSRASISSNCPVTDELVLSFVMYPLFVNCL